jgi:hypothetical protein
MPEAEAAEDLGVDASGATAVPEIAPVAEPQPAAQPVHFAELSVKHSEQDKQEAAEEPAPAAVAAEVQPKAAESLAVAAVVAQGQ